VRCTRRFPAHLDQSVVARQSIGVGIVGDGRKQHEVALRGDTHVSAVHGLDTVAKGIDAGFDGLAAAIRTGDREAKYADQSALRNRENDRAISGLGAGGMDLRNQISHQGPLGLVTRYPPVSIRAAYAAGRPGAAVAMGSSL